MPGRSQEPPGITVAETESLREQPDGFPAGASDPACLELPNSTDAESRAIGQLFLGEPGLDPQVEQEQGEAEPPPIPTISVRQGTTPHSRA
ncbi:MAG: hypothetical protein QOH50_3016 [Kribbellaceae bacterium]|nr:hypothetical protein [Kribbellaceae bacterium]